MAHRDRLVVPPLPTHHRRHDGLLFGSAWVTLADALDLTTSVPGAEWAWKRPSTAVVGDGRLHPPGFRLGAEERQYKGTIDIAVLRGQAPPPPPLRTPGDRSLKVPLEDRLTLQGFDPGYPVQGKTKRSRDLQVGNAIPPPLARAIVGALEAPLKTSTQR